jgi:hypothetical protein
MEREEDESVGGVVGGRGTAMIYLSCGQRGAEELWMKDRETEWSGGGGGMCGMYKQET